MTASMTAWAIDAFGPPECFHPVKLPVPEPRPNEVLIEVHASSVNPVDYKIRDGRAGFLAPSFPAVLHPDCAGEVCAVGAAVTGFAPGDRVFSFATGIGGKPGALADYMVADAAMVAKAPRNLSHAEAAALPLVSATAWFSLIDQGGVGPGHSVLIEGGTGGVGHVAVQLARWRGARVVAMCGTAEKRRTAVRLGAEQAFGYLETSPEEVVSVATDGRGFAIVYNTPGAPSIDHAVAVAAFGGTILDILGAFPVQPGFQMKWLSFRSVFAGRPILTGEGTTRIGAILGEIARLCEAGDIVPLIDERRFTFDRVAEAHVHAEHGRPTGKVVLLHPDRSG